MWSYRIRWLHLAVLIGLKHKAHMELLTGVFWFRVMSPFVTKVKVSLLGFQPNLSISATGISISPKALLCNVICTISKFPLKRCDKWLDYIYRNTGSKLADAEIDNYWDTLESTSKSCEHVDHYLLESVEPAEYIFRGHYHRGHWDQDVDAFATCYHYIPSAHM